MHKTWNCLYFSTQCWGGEDAMCGRFSQKSSSKKIAKKFEVEEVPPLIERFNVAPAQGVLGIREGIGAREATFFKWGLVPRWAKDPAIGNKLINARSETI